MTDDDFTVSEESAGALTHQVIRWGSNPGIDRYFERMFMFSLNDGNKILDMCREAGFPTDTETAAEPLETLATRYTGAAPSIADAEDIPASKCWLLVHFAIAHNDYLAAKDRGDVTAAMEAGFLLGRLTEWWRWRGELHDAAAVHGRHFSEKHTGAATRARGRKADENRTRIIEMAQRVLAIDPGCKRDFDNRFGRHKNDEINVSDLARRCMVMSPPVKIDRVRQILRQAIVDGILI